MAAVRRFAGSGGRSVLLASVIDQIRLLENTNRSVLKNFLETEYFGSRSFRFGFGSNRINRNFSEDLNTIINILVLRQIYAILYSFLIIIIYKKTIAI